MDTNMEDKMYHQIEKSLTNNINDNLFISGRTSDKDKRPVARNTALLELPDHAAETKNSEPAYPKDGYDYGNQIPALSRAEYIRQAREACLRQLSSQSVRIMDYNPPDVVEQELPAVLNKKKTRALSLFKENENALKSPWNAEASQREDSPQELASFQSLIIRTVCAIVLFIGIFLIDKFNFSVGAFSKDLVRQYVTGKDFFLKMEQMVVSWLK